jgi:hypothetical protein
MVLSDIDHSSIPWEQSGERTQMIMALRDGRIPLKSKDSEGRRTTNLELIWGEWCPNYSRRKVALRLAALCKIVEGELQPRGFKEPRRWENSVAYRLLEQDIRKGLVEVNNQEDHSDFEMVYLMRPEYAAFDHTKFKQRLEALRKSAGKSSSRAQEDEKRFEAFFSKHSVSLFSHKGYTQWQGSDAQKALQGDICENKHCTMRKRDLYGSRPEYYHHFPLKAFRDFVTQEVRTGKWKHTLAVKGMQFKAS